MLSVPRIISRAAPPNCCVKPVLNATPSFLKFQNVTTSATPNTFQDILTRYRSQGFKVAIDDYGSGFAQLRALYECEPDIIKIDRFFIDGIDRDRRKELFVSQITAFAHMIAAQVVAEGVETREEFLCCRRIGCDLVQGFFIARPSVDLPERTDIVPAISGVAIENRRGVERDGDVLRSYLLETPPIENNINPVEILSYFQKNTDIAIAPVINRQGEPLGVIRDSVSRLSYTRHLVASFCKTRPTAQISAVFAPLPDCRYQYQSVRTA